MKHWHVKIQFPKYTSWIPFSVDENWNEDQIAAWVQVEMCRISGSFGCDGESIQVLKVKTSDSFMSRLKEWWSGKKDKEEKEAKL